MKNTTLKTILNTMFHATSVILLSTLLLIWINLETGFWPKAWISSFSPDLAFTQNQSINPFENNTLTVHYDPGGLVLERGAQIFAFKRQNVSVRVKGFCYSACTYNLALENICTHGNSVWMFHQPHLHGEALPKEHLRRSQMFDRLLLGQELASWLRTIPQKTDVYMTGQDIIERGWATVCEGWSHTANQETQDFVYTANTHHNPHLKPHILSAILSRSEKNTTP